MPHFCSVSCFVENISDCVVSCPGARIMVLKIFYLLGQHSLSQTRLREDKTIYPQEYLGFKLQVERISEAASSLYVSMCGLSFHKVPHHQHEYE